jgi:caffeoyl-CoA O-methyltransferase
VPDKFTALTPALHDYLVAHSGPPGDLLRRLAAETESSTDRAIMQIAPEQGALMGLLAKAIGARRALELGTFTGYSAICVARSLPEDGTLVTCDVNEEWTAIARRYWEEAGLAGRIDLRLGPALDTVAELAGGEPFDFAFIDADKQSYPDYWEAVVELVRPGGLILVDNVLYGGEVVGALEGEDAMRPHVDESERSPSLDAILRTNEMIQADDRVGSVMVGIADGITIALRRSAKRPGGPRPGD